MRMKSDGDIEKGLFETCIPSKTYNKTFLGKVLRFEIVSFLRLFLKIVSCFCACFTYSFEWRLYDRIWGRMGMKS